ncbi:MAG: family 1 glycosylhydrolase [Acutalibacteraceae bacterium]
MWDVYLHENHLENGDVASDHYHRFREDIRMMKEGGTEQLPLFTGLAQNYQKQGREVNQEGIDFYNRLIDACLEYGITPMVTIFHWDLPQYLEEKGRMAEP